MQTQAASLQAELRELQQATRQREEASHASALEAAHAADQRVSAAEAQRDETRRVLQDITRQLSDARDAVKVPGFPL